MNKGARHGLYVGQAVIDAYGLFGQVMEVGASVARVLLISDPRHSVPVQVNRNGQRFIVEGDSDFTQLKLPHVALTADIKEGDVLSTSGLGQLFPAGYPVAKIQSITYSPGMPFAEIVVSPFAKLDQSRHVLLLFSDDRHQIAHVKSDDADEPSNEVETEAEAIKDTENKPSSDSPSSDEKDSE